MNAATLVMLAVLLVPAVWVLHKVAKVLAAVFEALAVLATVAVMLWWAVKLAGRAVRWLLTHPRSTLAAVIVAAWCTLVGCPRW